MVVDNMATDNVIHHHCLTNSSLGAPAVLLAGGDKVEFRIYYGVEVPLHVYNWVVKFVHLSCLVCRYVEC